MKRDKVFNKSRSEISEFVFDESVADVFDDMLMRSVPGYGTIISLIAVLAKRYAQNNSNIYDIGSSLGTATIAMSKNITADNCNIIACDMSKSMVDRFSEVIKDYNGTIPINLVCDDALLIDYKSISVAVLNLTLQFIEPSDRDSLIHKIYNAMVPGGLLIIAEKISDSSKDELMTDLYYEFKRANSYSELEISQKRTALENVLITDSENDHINRCTAAGFTRIERIFQALTFRAYAIWK